MTRAVQETGPTRPSLIARSAAAVQPDLRVVSLQIDAASIGAMVGPNRGGKSTLLRVFAGVTQPIEGAVVANGSRQFVSRTLFQPDALVSTWLKSSPAPANTSHRK